MLWLKRMQNYGNSQNLSETMRVEGRSEIIHLPV